MSIVFVSHSSLDHDYIDKHILPLLKQHGLTPWFSKDSIQGADEWERKIKEGLISSDWFLVVLSRNSVASPWVKAEVAWALANRRERVVPVLIDDCDPADLHLLLSQIQYVDFRGNSTASRQALLEIWNEKSADVKHSADGSSIENVRSHKRGLRPALFGCIFGVVGATLLLLVGIVWGWFSFTDRSDEQPDSWSVDGLAVNIGLHTGLAEDSDDAADRAAGRRLSYWSKQEDGTLFVDYSLPYLDSLEEGEIRGISSRSSFIWDIPELSVRVVNNSQQTVVIDQLDVTVASSETADIPIPTVSSGQYGAVVIRNEGWADMVGTVVRWTFARSIDDELPSSFAHVVDAGTISERYVLRIPLADIPDDIGAEGFSVAILGEIEYGPTSERRGFAFRTIVSRAPASGAPLPPSYTYPLILGAGEAGETRTLSVPHVIQAGEADHFLIQIAADRSAAFDLILKFYDAERNLVAQQPVHLNLFVPRNEAALFEEEPGPEN